MRARHNASARASAAAGSRSTPSVASAIAIVPTIAAVAYSSCVSPRHKAARRSRSRFSSGSARGSSKQRRPAQIACRAVGDGERLARFVGPPLRFAAFAAEHRHARFAELQRGVAVDRHVTGMEHRLDRSRRVERVDESRQRMDRRAQAEDRAQGEQFGEPRAECVQRQIDEIVRFEFCGRFVEAVGDRQAEAGDRFAHVQASSGVAFEPVHRNAPAGVGERQRREQEPRQTSSFSGVTRPVEVGADRRPGQRRADGAHETGDFVAGLLFDPEQHQESADLLGPRIAGEDHRHRFLGLGQRQGARQRLAAAKNGDESREGMLVRLPRGSIAFPGAARRRRR